MPLGVRFAARRGSNTRRSIRPSDPGSKPVEAGVLCLCHTGRFPGTLLIWTLVVVVWVFGVRGSPHQASRPACCFSPGPTHGQHHQGHAYSHLHLGGTPDIVTFKDKGTSRRLLTRSIAVRRAQRSFQRYAPRRMGVNRRGSWLIYRMQLCTEDSSGPHMDTTALPGQLSIVPRFRSNPQEDITRCFSVRGQYTRPRQSWAVLLRFPGRQRASGSDVAGTPDPVHHNSSINHHLRLRRGMCWCTKSC